MKNYENMSKMEQEHFIAHAGIELVQRMYHEKDKKGLESFSSKFRNGHKTRKRLY